MANEITGVDNLCRSLERLRTACPAAARQAMSVCAERCKQTAVRYAPRSPTMANASAALKRKKRSTQRRYPGNLEKSIECEYDERHASVFVAQNAFCVSKYGFNYAKKIHDERGKSWQRLGAGSIAKGAGVGEKFIERGIKDNVAWCLRAIEGRLKAVLSGTWKK